MGSEQVYLDCGVDAAQAARVGGQRGPVPAPGDVHDMSGAAVEDIGGEKQLIDLVGRDGVQLAEYHRRVTHDLGESGHSVGPYRAYLGQCECGQVQR